MHIKEMLETEIESSERFTQDNFGLKVGDGFPELVREIAMSNKVAMKMVIGMIMTSMTIGKDITEDFPKEKDGSWAPVILKHLSIFEQPLSLLYWGIQIGRRLQKEESESLNKMEG